MFAGKLSVLSLLCGTLSADHVARHRSVVFILKHILLCKASEIHEFLLSGRLEVKSSCSYLILYEPYAVLKKQGIGRFSALFILSGVKLPMARSSQRVIKGKPVS